MSNSLVRWNQGTLPAAVVLIALLVIGVATRVAQSQQADPGDSEDAQPQAHGPVHEAFAEPVVFDPAPGVTVPQEPPEPIEELPPDTKPEGENVTWIPGYWSWDDDNDKFLWVSGFWRDIPPGREWVPGYWTKSGGRWQWVAGYWAGTDDKDDDDQVDYLPQPPETLETGPSTPAPTTGHIWVPGCWMWRDVRYTWRPGYWVVGRPNWVWVPAHYIWTPGGYVFVSGYWDLPVPSRGILFAPVMFSSPIYVRPGFRYSPAVVVNLALFTNHLFVRPAWGCYYFGDYYAARYATTGFYPWYRFHSGNFGYDPLYVSSYHQHVHVQKQTDWAEQLKRDYAGRVEHEDMRPSRDIKPFLAAAGGNQPGGDLSQMGLVTTMGQVSTARDLPVKLEKIDDEKRQEIGRRVKDTHEFTRQREQLERVADTDLPMPREGRRVRGDDVTGKAKPGDDAVTKSKRGDDVVGPKLEGPKVTGTRGKGDTDGKSGAVDGIPRKLGRPKSPVGDKTPKGTVVARDVPPKLDPPTGIDTVGGRSKGDTGTRSKTGGSTRGKPRSGDSPKVDVPRTVPKVDQPRTTPKGDPPRNNNSPRNDNREPRGKGRKDKSAGTNDAHGRRLTAAPEQGHEKAKA